MTPENQETIGTWAVSTFGGPPGLTPRHCIRLLEEVVELCLAGGASSHEIRLGVGKVLSRDCFFFDALAAPSKVPEELADAAIILLTLAHRRGVSLQEEVDRKMKVNRFERKWISQGDGTGYHRESTKQEDD